MKYDLMNKICNLTAQQERDLIAYREQWLAVGRSTEPADRAVTELAISEMYKIIGHEKPYFWWCDGPVSGSFVRTILKANLLANLGANLRANLLANLGANLGANLRDNLLANLMANLRDNLWDNLGANLRDNLWDNLLANLGANLGANLRANLGDNLGDNLWDNLRDNLLANLGATLRDNLWDNLMANLRANLRDNLWDNLWANLGDNLRDNLLANLGANLRANLGDNLDWTFWGQHESYWPVYYYWPHIALRRIHKPDELKHLELWLQISRSCGWWIAFKGIVFVCERPQRQAVDERGFLHHETGPALLCRDGWPVYALHGVRMKPEHVETTAERIDPENVLHETNADVRRELIRKVGVERMLSKMEHRVMDTRGNYSLLSIKLSEEVVDARYLRMLNPSIGVWHLEGVDPSCGTVESALNWRNQNWHTEPELLT